MANLLTELWKLFGFKIGDDPKPEQEPKSFTMPQNEDGAVTIQAGGVYGTYVDLEGIARNEVDLINRYRELSLQPETEDAIANIVNEAIVMEDDEPPIDITTQKLEGYSDDVKNAIRDEFHNILQLLNFNNEGHDIFKRWYIDGRLFYHVMIDDKDTEEGIQELRFIDPRRIRKVREIKKKINELGVEIVDTINEYYVYNERGIANVANTIGIRIATDSICHVHSGIIESGKNIVISNLHKAIKPANQLRMMEDALVIYRISRAPERRVFYIDIGTLPKQRAEQYMESLINKHRNKLIYDVNTGNIVDDKRHLSMMEDFWFPRREGGKGTEVTTLQGGQNLSQIEDITYFQERLFKALNVPVSRLKSDAGFSLGRAAEISRDELNFFLFVSRLRTRFSQLFDQLLYTQLILKGVIAKEDWDEIRQGIYYKWQKDSYFSELKESEIRRNRIAEVNETEPLVGKYFSKKYVQTKILQLTEEDIEKMEEEMQEDGSSEQAHQAAMGAAMPFGMDPTQDPNAQIPIDGDPTAGQPPASPKMPFDKKSNPFTKKDDGASDNFGSADKNKGDGSFFDKKKNKPVDMKKKKPGGNKNG